MENWIWLICPSRSIRVIFCFLNFPPRPPLGPGIFSRVHRHVVRRQFPPCSFDGKGKWDALPCLPAGSSRPRRVLVQGFLLFYFIFSGWTRTPWTGGGSGWRDRRTDRRFFFFFFFPPRKKSNNFFLFVSTTTAGIIFCAGHAKVAVTRLVCCDIGRRLHAGRKTMAQPVPVPNGQRARSIISRGRKTFSFFFFHFSFVST